MITSTIVFAEVTPILYKNYNYRFFPSTKTSSIKLIDNVNFVVTDLSTLYKNLVQTQITLNHTLTLKHQESTFFIDVSVQPPKGSTKEQEIVEPIWVEQLLILDNFNTAINIFSEIHVISNYIVEDNIQIGAKSGRYVPIIPVEFDRYPDLYDTFIIENPTAPAPTTSYSISETVNVDIVGPIVPSIGNIGPMIRLNRQPRLFEEHLSLANCVAILDTSGLTAGELNIIYSFEAFVEFGKQYDEIAIVDLGLVDSIGFVDAYPYNPLNSLKFDKTTGAISGTINFLDKVLYVIELESKSAIVAILNPKLPLPL